MVADAAAPLNGTLCALVVLGMAIGGLVAGSLTREFTLADGVALRLARLYGAEAALVAARGRSPLTSGTSVLLGEVDWAVQEEGATCVEDVLYRRTRAALYLPSEREALVQPIAERMQSLLDWTQTRLEGEVGAVRARLAEDAGTALEQIESVSKDLSALIASISEEAHTQSVTATEIAVLMKSVQKVSILASAGSTQAATSVEKLAELVMQLSNSVTDFKLPEDVLIGPGK